MKKLIKNGVIASTILFLGFIGICIFTWFFHPNQNLDWSSLSLGKDLRIAITENWGGNLVFFNQDRPYTGSVVSFAGDESVKITGYDFYGIYFRKIYHTQNEERNQWTFMISLWYPVVLFGILPVIFAIRKLSAHMPKKNFDLRKG